MGFQVSPGVNVSEIDLTTIIPAVSTTTGALAGHFKWGPVGQRVLVDSEDTLVKQFNTPSGNTYVDFFTAANFLAYGNALYTVRVINESGTAASNTARGRNATTNAANTKNTIIKNEDDYENNYSSGISDVGNWVAKYPGSIGNNLRISVCLTANAYESTIAGACAFTNNSTTVTFTTATSVNTKVVAGDILILGPDRQQRKVASVSGNTVTLQTKYVGYYSIGDKALCIHFKNKPHFIHRLFTKVLLSWKWYDTN